MSPNGSASSKALRAASSSRCLKKQRMSLDVIPNSRLTGSTVGYAFRTDSPMKPFIALEPVMPEFQFIGGGSEHAFKTNQYVAGIKAINEVDYGQWAHAIKFTLS